MMNDVTHLNPAAVQRLQRLGGNEFVVKMIDLFTSYAREKLAAARQALTAGQLEALADAVHPIKSSAGNVGATVVQDLARRIEELARQSEREPLAGLLEELEDAFQTAVKELGQLKLGPGGPKDGAR